MKTFLEYLIMIVIGVAAVVGLMFRSDAIDKNMSKDNSNCIVLFGNN